MEMQNRLSPSVSTVAFAFAVCRLGGGGDAVTGLLGRLQRLKCRRRTCVRALLAAARCTAAHVANWVIGHASGL